MALFWATMACIVTTTAATATNNRAGRDVNTAFGGIPDQAVRQIVTRVVAEHDPGAAR